MLKLKEIVLSYLKVMGYDGLYSDGDCGCTLDELMPCDEPKPGCEPGYLQPCDCGDHDFHIGVKAVGRRPGKERLVYDRKLRTIVTVPGRKPIGLNISDEDALNPTSGEEKADG